MVDKSILSMGVSVGYNLDIAKEYGINEAIMLNRLVFLTRHTKRADGFVWQTAEEWLNHTGLTKRQVNLASEHLIECEKIEKKITYIAGTKNRATHYKILESNKMSLSVNNIRNSKESLVATNVDDESHKLAKLLHDLMLKNKADRRIDLNWQENWAKQIRLAHEKDKRDYGKIERVIRWSQQDSFWKAIILSGKNLREKFDKLEDKMNMDKNFAKNNRPDTIKGWKVYKDLDGHWRASRPEYNVQCQFYPGKGHLAINHKTKKLGYVLVVTDENDNPIDIKMTPYEEK